MDIVLQPRDGLTIKDPRGFNVAGGTLARSLPWPTPMTLAGAVRTQAGFARGLSPQPTEQEKEAWDALRTTIAVSGPYAVHRTNQDAWTMVWPAPRDALAFPGRRRRSVELVWVAPQRVDAVRATWETGSGDDRRATEGLLWGRADDPRKALAGDRWWSSREFLGWLQHPKSKPMDQGRVKPPQERFDAHVGLNEACLTVEEGKLFGHDTWEYLRWEGGRGKGYKAEELGVAVRTEGETLELPAWWRLGGESRLARAEALDGGVFAFPENELGLGKDETVARFRLVLVTPACFRAGWCPDWLTATETSEGWMFEGPLPAAGGPRVRLRAAFVDRPMAVSGWDFAKRAPKPSRRLVPAGSVYFFEVLGGAMNREAWEALWLSTIQEPESQDALDGFGRVVPGRWPDDD